MDICAALTARATACVRLISYRLGLSSGPKGETMNSGNKDDFRKGTDTPSCEPRPADVRSKWYCAGQLTAANGSGVHAGCHRRVSYPYPEDIDSLITCPSFPD
jgi:hypothetical protein